MGKAITKALLALYSLVNRTGLLETAWCRKLFLRAYFLYKEHVEDPFAALIKARPEFFEGGHILDIGANVGYTVSLFSKAASRQFKVFAFEPDSSNFAMLKQVIASQSHRDQIVPILAAVGSTDGTVELWHNRGHHGDHRIFTPKFRESGAETQRVSSVPLISVDSFAKAEGIEASIKFVKVDVQGYELPVCQGMARTLERNTDLVIALEYSPSAIRELGFEPEKVIGFFHERNYFIYILEQDGSVRPLNDRALERALENCDYVNLLISARHNLN
jgi:FkbM family methyltransferase